MSWFGPSIQPWIFLLVLLITSVGGVLSAQDPAQPDVQGTLPETTVPRDGGNGDAGQSVPSPFGSDRGLRDPLSGSPDPLAGDPNFGAGDPDALGRDNQPPGPSGESLLDYGIQLDGGSRSPLNLFNDPSHRSVIDMQQIGERAAVDMFDAIQREVGVLVQRTQRGAAAPFIRGLTGQQVLILVDGIRLNNATFRAGPNQYFNTIDPGMVERIEVLRGPQTVLYGADAIGGAINIVTRSASNRFTSYDAHGSLVNRYSSADNGYYTRANFEGSTANVAFLGGGWYGNFNDLDRGGDLGRQPLTSYSHHAGDGKVDFLLDDNAMLTVAIQHFNQEDVGRSDRFPGRLTIFDPQQRSLSYVRYQGVDLPGWFDRIMFTASFHRQKQGVFDRRLSTDNIDLSEVDNHSFGATALLSSDLGSWGRVTYGADMYHDSVGAVKDRYSATTNRFVESRTPTYPDDGVYNQVGVYGQWNVDLTSRLSGQAGLRYTYISAHATPVFDVDDDMDPDTPAVATPIQISPTFDNWSSTAGLVYEWTPRLHVVANMAQGFRAPNLDDLAATNENVQQDATDIPSVDLLPEESISYDVGFKLESAMMRGQFAYFWTDIDNMILRSRETGDSILFSRTNRDARVNGLEFGGAIDAGGCWELYGNISYFLGEEVLSGDPLSRIPPTQGIMGIRWRNPNQGAYFDVFAWMADRQDRLAAQDVTDRRIPDGGTPGFATFNARLGRQLTPYQRISLNLENLFDKAYRVHGSGVDGPGFSAIVSYELQH